MNKYRIEYEKYRELRKTRAYLYAKSIVDGDILANKYIILECQRFIAMVDNPDSRLFKKFFVDMKTLKFIDTIVGLTNFATGEFAGQPCYDYIAGFQWYILINIYCVKHRDNPKKRRYEKACVFVARKNAKVLAC